MAYNTLLFSPMGNLPIISNHPQLVQALLNTTLENELCEPAQKFVKFIDFFGAKKQDLFPHLPCADDIQQGKLGNCFLLTALLSIVQVNPHYIVNMMRDCGDNTVVVRFYSIDPLAHNPQDTTKPWYIQINKSLLVNRNGQPLSKHQAPWVFILEKAYAYWCKSFVKLRYIPKHEVLDGKVWVRRPTLADVPGLGSKPIETMAEALDSGTVQEALQFLLGNIAHQQPLQREEIVKNDVDDDENVYEPLRCLHNILRMNTMNYQSCTESQEIILGQNYQAFTSFLLPYINTQLSTTVDKLIKTKDHIIRRHTLHQLIDTHLAVLQASEIGRNIRAKLFDYIDTHFPEKRGSIDYTRKNLGEFEHIFQLLRNNNVVSISTREKIGDPHRQLSRDEGNRVRGLLGNHAYHVLDCFKRRNGLYYFLLGNPWDRYGRSYITREGSPDARYMLGEKTIPVESGSSHWLHAPQSPITRTARGYTNEHIEQLCRNNNGRIFAIELTDLSKRFVHVEWCQLPSAPAIQVA